MKISIIVPVYNNAGYLRTCLNSLVEQTYTDLEIICINDASTDNSLDILNHFALKYPNIKVISNKYNLGAGATRNIGIDEATGEYIGFVDADDYVNVNMYQELYECVGELGNPEIVYTNLHYVTDDRMREYNVPRSKKGYAGTPITNKMMITSLNPSMCNKIVRKDFLGETRFMENSMWEDAAMTYSLHVRANSFASIDNHNYYYRQNKDGLSRKNSHYNPDIYDIFKVIDEIKKEAKANNRDKFYHKELRLIYFALAFGRIGEAMKWKPRSSEEKSEIIRIRKKMYVETYNHLGTIEGVDTAYLSGMADSKVINNYIKLCSTKKKKQIKKVASAGAIAFAIASGLLITRKMVSDIKKKSR